MKLDQEDIVISEFLNSIGPWSNYIVIGGGYALFIYKLYLSDQKLENHPVGTRDIDSLIPRKIPEISKKNIAQHLQEAGFTYVFKDMDEPTTEAYKKKINGLEIEIEFLTHDAVRNNKNKNIVIAGVVAQPLRYLTLSLNISIKFQTYSNKIGRVVSPAAWIFHKSLTFMERKSPLKTLKDLYGIWYVTTQLGDFSENAIAEFNILKQQHPKWYKSPSEESQQLVGK